MKSGKNNIILNETIDALYNQASAVIEQARETAYRQVNEALVKRNWEIGKLIAEEELNGQNRAIYGAAIIKGLSKRLTDSFGKGFTKTNLYDYKNISMRCFRRFSTHCVENLRFYYRGLITERLFRNLMPMLVLGMSRKL